MRTSSSSSERGARRRRAAQRSGGARGGGAVRLGHEVGRHTLSIYSIRVSLRSTTLLRHFLSPPCPLDSFIAHRQTRATRTCTRGCLAMNASAIEGAWTTSPRTRSPRTTKHSTRRTKRSHSSVSARWCLYWTETLHSRLSVPAGSNASRVQSFVATRSRQARLRVPSSASARSYPRQARS